MCGENGADATHCLDVCNGYEAELTGVDEFEYRYYLVSAKKTRVGTCGEKPSPIFLLCTVLTIVKYGTLVGKICRSLWVQGGTRGGGGWVPSRASQHTPTTPPPPPPPPNIRMGLEVLAG